MKKPFIFLILSFFLFNRAAIADYWDTGWMEFKQPNGTKFIGRILGDEYEFQNITKDGYPFDKSPQNNYYYYAERAVSYKYILSDKKVGIDIPSGIEKNLKVFMDSRPGPSSLSGTGLKKTILAATTYTIKVVLVRFTDIAEYQDPLTAEKFTKTDFEEMLSGSNYEWTAGTDNNPPRIAYGSMDQYYDIMSNGDVIINGVVQNNSPGGQPEWIILPNTKYYYYTHSMSTFDADAKTAAIAAGIDVSVNSTTKVCYIYAKETQKGGLNPHAEYVGGNVYVASELCYEPNSYFKGIGVHCHEFGHVLGFYDLYNDGVNSTFHWALMGNGSANGNSYDGTCPAPINPFYRSDKGWISVASPSVPNNGLNFPYDEQNPTVYHIAVANDNYYFENRRYNGFSRFCPGHEDGDGGILVWHTRHYDSVDLIEADGSGPGDVGGSEGYGDVWPGSTNNRNLNDFTTPNSNLWYGGNSNVILHNISDPVTTMTGVLGDAWFGNVALDLTWENNIEFGGDVAVPNGIVLTIDPSVIANLNGNVLKSTGGAINRDYSSTFNPDIQLLQDGTTLIGQYSTIHQALTDVQDGDKIDVNSDIILSSSLDITGDITIELINNHYIKAQSGTITRGPNVVFIPDIQLFVSGTTLIGQYPTVQQAIADASSGDEIKVNCDLVITENVNLLQGYKLTIAPGTTLQFDPGVSLNIYGRLDASGGWNDPITFECSNPSSYWGGIKFQPDSDESSTITRCDISRATYGIFLDHVAPAIRYYNNISNCAYGIYGRYCAPDGFEHCDFDFNAYDGIHLENGNAVGNWHVPILHNNFGMNLTGVFLYDTDAKIWQQNYFFNNSAYAIYANSECDLDMIDCDEDMNTMQESNTGELYFREFSSAYLGDLWL